MVIWRTPLLDVACAENCQIAWWDVRQVFDILISNDRTGQHSNRLSFHILVLKCDIQSTKYNNIFFVKLSKFDKYM